MKKSKISLKIHRFREKKSKIGFSYFWIKKNEIYVFISPGLYLHALETNFWWCYKFLKIDQNHNFFLGFSDFWSKNLGFFFSKQSLPISPGDKITQKHGFRSIIFPQKLDIIYLSSLNLVVKWSYYFNLRY